MSSGPRRALSCIPFSSNSLCDLQLVTHHLWTSSLTQAFGQVTPKGPSGSSSGEVNHGEKRGREEAKEGSPRNVSSFIHDTCIEHLLSTL